MKKLLVSILFLISINACADQFSDKLSMMSNNLRRNFASNPQIQNFIKNTNQRKVAQCGAFGTLLLAQASRRNDEDSLMFAVAFMEAYMLKKAQVQNIVYLENEYKISLDTLNRNQSAYTDMCAHFLKDISSVMN